MSMPSHTDEDRVDAHDRHCLLYVRGKLADMVAKSEIHTLFWVFDGAGALTDNEPFFVLVLTDRLWVIPDDTFGIVQWLRWLLQEPLPELRRAVLDACPWSWRRRTLGLPLFPLPRLGRFPRSTLPRWEAQASRAEDIKRANGIEP